ncbi:asparagine synthase (glutamine-hydrolyzing) [Bacteroides sp.]|uniref:asparagine synthase (glutamine-hydrolyzing) n=1 Tax=Bacteroides sp. TaxID=29523 RepID=UPI00261F8B3A|nr:asparagine synthase (glutamine-hydrolyzing) [Bacteroides sp.]MDD3040659.1 asparagine synthase (glutamine-hydrolyzing) [Bacteroides sp.]
MCGITFLINRDNQPIEVSVISHITNGLKHRGPDHQDTWTHNNVGLGHTRLAIIDPEGGQQPLFNETKDIVVIFNGEIYNHKFLRTTLENKGHILGNKSDGAVIPHLFEEYGADCFLKLDGMFSIILYDLRHNKIYIVRDRLGIKPLVTYIDENIFIGGSEIRALLRHPKVPRQINRQSIADFLTFGYPMEPDTVLKNIYSFKPGEIGIYDLANHKLSCSPYWKPSFPKHNEYSSYSGKQIREEFESLFLDVIGTHIDADVPVACYISGGIDSSAVTAAIALRRPDLKAFSLSFSQAKFDEMRYATEVTEKSNVQLHKVQADNITLENLYDAVIRVEQPQIFTLDVANQLLSSTTSKTGFKVVLTGDGADEMLGGYDHFMADAWRRRIAHIPGTGWIFNKILSNLGYPKDFHTHYKKVMIDEKSKPIGLFGFIPPWYAIWRLNQNISFPLLKYPGRDPLDKDGPIANICAHAQEHIKNIAPLNKAIYLEMHTRLPSWTLWKADRNPMVNSLEARLPYLDNRLIDFFLKIPPHFKMNLHKEKYILREGFRNLLPKSILKRRKYAFNTPINKFLLSPEKLDQWLGHDALIKTDIFREDAVLALLNKIKTPEPSEPFKHALEVQTLIGVLTTQMLLLHYEAT